MVNVRPRKRIQWVMVSLFFLALLLLMAYISQENISVISKKADFINDAYFLPTEVPPSEALGSASQGAATKGREPGGAYQEEDDEDDEAYELQEQEEQQLLLLQQDGKTQEGQARDVPVLLVPQGNDLEAKELTVTTEEPKQPQQQQPELPPPASAPRARARHPVVCKDPDVLTGPPRPVFVFILGAEGTGHHLVTEAIFSFSGVHPSSNHVKHLFAEIWEPTTSDPIRKARKREIKELMEEEARKLQAKMAAGSKQEFYVIQLEGEMLSAPYDSPRNSLRRPDIYDLIALVEPHFDLKILVTVRNPFDSVISLIRRGWWSRPMCTNEVKRPWRTGLFTMGSNGLGDCSHVHVQGRVVEDAMVYINSQLKGISRQYYRVLRYEEIVDQPQRFAEPVARFLGTKPYYLNKGLTKVSAKPGRGLSSLAPDQQESLLAIFHPSKQSLWEYINESILDDSFNSEPETCLEKSKRPLLG